MKHWLLTSTTYGTWLPGDNRGFVSNVRVGPGPEVRHNIPGTPYDADMPELEQAANARLVGPSVFLTSSQAEAVAEQFRETAAHRQWRLLALAVMCNHFHIVVGAVNILRSSDLLRDFKSYASRRLNRRWTRPESGTWWTESGSRRRLRSARAVRNAVNYVRRQPNALVVWLADGEGEPDDESGKLSGG